MKLAVLAASLLVVTTTSLSAQDYPTRPITLISPNAPGGANDTIARIFAAEMSKDLGQQIVIVNQGGAGGVIGAQMVAEAAPDGYTLLAGSVSTHSFAPLTKPDLAYDPIKDFAPIARFGSVPNLLVVNPKLGVGSVKELIAKAKANPGKLNYASGGIGSTSHFAGAMFVGLADINKETVHVPYGGGALSMTATVAGEVQFYFGPIAGMVPLSAAGKVTPIGISGAKRTQLLPDVPTMAEAGMAEYTAVGWFGLMAPDGTSPKIIDRLSESVQRAAMSPAVAKFLAEQGIEPQSDTPAKFAEFIAEQLEAYRALVKRGIITVE